MEEEANTNNADNRQLQVRNMQGLLNFCTNVTAQEDTTKDTPQMELDPERREFLENVLRSIQGNTAKHISDIIQLLSQDCVADSMDNVNDQEDALDNLAEYIEDLNHAVDFYKMNGFPVILRLLSCPHVELQTKAARVLGYICQNNKDGQKDMLALGPMKILLDTIDRSSNVDVRVQSLFAVSCLVRGYDSAEREFVALEGFQVLMKLFGTEDPSMLIKVVFIMRYFVQDAEIRQEVLPQLLKKGLVEAVVTALFSSYSHGLLRETCLVTLATLSSKEEAAPKITRSDLDLLNRLEERTDLIRGDPDLEDEYTSINEVLPHLYPLHGREMLRSPKKNEDDPIR